MTSREIYTKLLEEANSITIITGAGVSTDSGVPDYQTADKTWNFEKTREELTSYSYFLENPESFWQYHAPLQKLSTEAKPNKFHKFAKSLASNGKSVTILTQNIDGLHGDDFIVLEHHYLTPDGDLGETLPPVASLSINNSYGDYEVIELHGNNKTGVCLTTNCSSKVEFLNIDSSLPLCKECGNILKPNLVLYGESVQNYDKAEEAVKNCDLLIVAGASLKVFPVNQLPYLLNDGVGRSVTMFDDESQTREFFKVLPQKSLWVNRDEAPKEYSFFTESFLGSTSDFTDLF